MSGRKVKRIIPIAAILLLSIPMHEFGHYIVAKTDGAKIHKINYLFGFNGTHFINPSITVNEFTFSSPITLILYCFAGLLITFVPGLIISGILYLRKSAIWKYPYMWAISAPLVALSDIDRVFTLLGLIGLSKWVYVGLGVSTTLMLGFMQRRGKWRN